ncbi:MAG: hypothetical protein ACLRJV_15645 [Eubacteriales bacterium]
MEQRLPVEPVKAEKVVPTDTAMAAAEPGVVEQADELPLPAQKAEMRIEPKGNDTPAQDEAPAYTQNTLWKSFAGDDAGTGQTGRCG